MPGVETTFTESELQKFDARLCEYLDRPEAEDEPIGVTVSFDGAVPAMEDLMPLGLARIGDLIIGKVTRAQLKHLATLPPVRFVSLMGESFLR